MRDYAQVLEVLRAAAGRGEDLPTALARCGLNGTVDAARRLANGEALPQALAGIVPPRIGELLAGSSPSLEVRAALLADERWRALARQRLLLDHISYPIASVVVVLIIAIVLKIFLPAGTWYQPLVSPLWILLPVMFTLLILIAPWAPPRWRLPGSAWVRHLAQAGRWSRAALAVRWRLTEADTARLLGVDLAPLAPVLAQPGAEVHSRLLADWHHHAASRSLARTARLLAALILLIGGVVVLASLRLWAGSPV